MSWVGRYAQSRDASGRTAPKVFVILTITAGEQQAILVALKFGPEHRELVVRRRVVTGTKHG